MKEVEYVDECPTCGTQFVGMAPEEFRETHAKGECPKAPLTSLFVFPDRRNNRERDTENDAGADQ